MCCGMPLRSSPLQIEIQFEVRRVERFQKSAVGRRADSTGVGASALSPQLKDAMATAETASTSSLRSERVAVSLFERT
jgi:hypothetical protein